VQLSDHSHGKFKLLIISLLKINDIDCEAILFSIEEIFYSFFIHGFLIKRKIRFETLYSLIKRLKIELWNL